MLYFGISKQNNNMKNKSSNFKLKIKMLVSLDELKLWNICPSIARIQLNIPIKDFYKKQ